MIDNLQAAVGVAQGRHDRPLFTFAHIPSPHGPIVFGPNGEALGTPPIGRFYDDTATPAGLTRSEFGRRYVGQVRYLNGLVLHAVEGILEASPTPPIILVLSDHGSGSGVDWTDLAHSDLDERSAILFAAYTPGHPDLFPHDITLVNVFGRLLGGYFGVQVAEQPDTLYRWSDTMSHLVEVKARARCPVDCRAAGPWHADSRIRPPRRPDEEPVGGDVAARRLSAMTPMTLSIVLPAYNEAERIGPGLDELFGYLPARRAARTGVGSCRTRSRSLVVDDGSTDATAEIVARPARGRRFARRDLPGRAAGAARRQGRGGPGRDAGRDRGPRASSPTPTWRPRPTRSRCS